MDLHLTGPRNHSIYSTPEQKEITTKKTKLYILGLKVLLVSLLFVKVYAQSCLVLADAFIEGPKVERLSKPYVIYKKDGSPFAFAGIYDTWINPDTGETIDSFAIITTVSNKITAAISHHRHPLYFMKKTRVFGLIQIHH